MSELKWPLSYVVGLARSYVQNTLCQCDKIPGGTCWRCLMRGALTQYDATKSERTTISEPQRPRGNNETR